MRETIRSWGTIAAATLFVQALNALALGGAENAARPLQPWLYGLVAAFWAVTTGRALAMRLDIDPQGVRSHGLWRTRHVAWHDVVLFQPALPPSARIPLWDHPSAIRFHGPPVPLTAVSGLLLRDGRSSTSRLCTHLNALCDQA